MKTDIQKWSVAWICSFINFLYLGLPRLSGMFYLAAITRYNVNRNQAALPFVLCYTVRNFAGPFIGCLSRKVKVETLILCGCILASVGVGLCFFAEDITTVSVLWGGIFGLGFGLSTILIPSVLNQHFDKYISNANGIAFGGECIAGFVLPPLYDFCLNAFGTSGSYLILAGLLLHGIPAAMLLRPPAKKSTVADCPEAKWDSWVSIDKAGGSSDNASERGTGKEKPKSEVKSLLCDSKSSYGTSNVPTAKKEPFHGSASSLDCSNLGCRYESSDQYVTLHNEVSPKSNLPSYSKFDNDSFDAEDEKLNRQTTANGTFTSASSGFISERAKSLKSLCKLAIRSEILSKSSNSYSFRENPQKNSKAVEPKETSQHEPYHEHSSELSLHGLPDASFATAAPLCKGTDNRLSEAPEPIHHNIEESELDLMDNSPQIKSSVSSSFVALRGEVGPSKEGVQLGVCNESSPSSELRKSPLCDTIQKDDCKVSEHAETRQNELGNNDISLQKCTTLSTSDIPESTRPCCPPPCAVFFDPAFLLILFTQSSSIFVATTFSTILVDFSIDAGVDAAAAVYVLMAFSAADMVGRFGLGWITDGAWLSGVAFSSLCFGVQGAVLLTAPVAYQGFGLVTGAVCVYGLVLGGLIVIGPVVVTEHIEKGAVNVALASRMVLYVPMSLAQSSMIGYFRDTLGSYNGILYLLGLLCIVCAILCALIPPAVKCRKVEFQESTGSAQNF